MNRIIYRTISIMAIFALTAGGYLNVGAASALPAFPGAVGFGSLTVGGRGGVVLQVTNLNDSGTGSLRDAVSKTGPRIIIFKVSGTIQLTQHIKIDTPYITILGQTSPGGIQLTGAGIKVRTHDVIIRGLMIRPGTGATGAPLSDRSGFLIHNDHDTSQPFNVVFDHNSIEWGVDENANTWLPVHDVTFSNNIIAEGLNCAGHPDGCHSMGLLIGTGAQHVTIYANLLANNDWRNPILQDNTSTEIYNNVLYSWKAGSIIIQGTGGGANFTNIVGNFTKATSCSTTAGVLFDSADTGSKVYLDDWTNVTGSKTLIDRVKSTTPTFVGSGISAMSAAQAYQYVLPNSGARNDLVDARVKDNVRNGKLPNGKCLIDSQAEVGGWPTPMGTAPFDIDNDGLPDSFELAHGVDLSPTAYAPSGYTWIEEYANSFYGSSAPASPSITPSLVPTFTSTPTQLAIFTSTPGATLTQPATFTAVPSATPTQLAIFTSTPGATLTQPATFTAIPSAIPLQPATFTATPSPVPTTTSTSTLVFTLTSAPVLPTATETIPPPTVEVTASLVPESPTVAASPVPVDATVTKAPLVIEPTFTLTSGPLVNNAISTPQASLETIYDNKNSGFVYSPGWSNQSNKQAYKRSYKFTTKNGAYVTFTFTGQSFSVIYKGGSAYRKMDVYVDNILVGAIDERTPSSTYQQRWNFTGRLTQGIHTLKLVFVTTDTSDTTIGSIDAVIIR